MLVDTSAWIEYFKGTEKGERIPLLLDQGKALFTCPLTLAELSHWCHRNRQDPSPFLKKVGALSTLLELGSDVLVESGRLYHEERKRSPKIGMIDCIIYATARAHRLALLTADRDFRNLPHVELI